MREEAGPAPEGLFGWMRLALGSLGILCVPVWALVASVLVQLRIGITAPPGWPAALQGGVLAALLLLPVLGGVMLGTVVVYLLRGWWRDRRERASWEHYQRLVGDGDTLRADAWAEDAPEEDAS